LILTKTNKKTSIILTWKHGNRPKARMNAAEDFANFKKTKKVEVPMPLSVRKTL